MTWRFLAPTERATSVLALLLAQQAQVGDTLCLYGDVGAGKSAFSRAYIRALVDDEHLAVPSPTFLLQQVYEDHDGLYVSATLGADDGREGAGTLGADDGREGAGT